MTNKQGVLYHMDGVEVCREGEWLRALALFQQVQPPSAAVTFNIGMCHMQLEQYEDAAEAFGECVAKDKYMAIAHYQLGVALSYNKKYKLAIEKFENSLEALRGNASIDYKQLGMKYKLFACEAHMNLSLLHLFNGDYTTATECLEKAVVLPREENKHFYINTALDALTNQDWSFFGDSPLERLVVLPRTCFFAPSKAKMDGLKSKSNFRDTAKVVSATDDTYSFVGFVGPKKLQKERQKDDIGVSQAVLANVDAPPLPSIAPPRKLSKSPMRSPPTGVPPMPLTAPPPLRRPSDQNGKPLINRDVKPNGNNFVNELSQITDSRSKQKPTSRPPPPSKQSISSTFHCNLNLNINIPKKKANTYNDLLKVLSEKLSEIENHLSTSSNKVRLQALDQKSGSLTNVDSQSWREVFLRAARDKQLQLTVELDQREVVPASPPVPFGSPPKPSHKPPVLPPSGESELYVDARAAQQDVVYVDARFHGQEDSLYTSAVQPRFR